MVQQRGPRRLVIVVASLAMVAAACSGATDPAGAPSTRAATGPETSTTAAAPTTGATTTPPVATTATTTRPAPTVTTAAPTTTVDLAATRWTVASITDGDTFLVETLQGTVPVRLIGINAPEGGECLAAEATAALRELIGGRQVGLQLDRSDVDQFDRWLRYVYVDDVLVNEALVERGLAIARRYEPDTTLAPVLEAAQARAQASGVGMWATDACGAAVGGDADIEIGRIEYDAPGNDNFNLNEEWVEFVNRGTGDVDLTGWGVKDESASHRYTFPNGFVLAVEASVILHTGCGDDTATDLYWCNTGSAIWNNTGDTVFLLDPSGNVVASQGY